MKPSSAFFITLIFVLSALAGCTSQTQDRTDVPEKARVRHAEVVNLNASLLDAARSAVDERFGPDRPLTLADIPSMLPKVLTNYNTTLSYILNMSLYPNIKVTQIGESLAGRAIFGVLMTDDGEYHPERPTVMLTCSQHGNEPSGSEACLIFIEYLTHGTDDFAEQVRTKLNIAINPLANPDGKEANSRGNYQQTDINRDHMNLVTLEGRAIHLLANMYRPVIGLDLHEFGGAGAPPPADAPVTTWNTFQIGMPHGFQDADQDLYRANTQLWKEVFDRMSEKYKTGSTTYYDGGTSVGFDPSVHRHHFMLRNSFSLLFETGGGLGVNNLPLRVEEHVTASFAVIRYFLANQATMVGQQQAADRTAQQPGNGARAWVIPPQKDTEKAIDFLSMHGVNYTILTADKSYSLVQPYGPSSPAPGVPYTPGGAPSAMTFHNGTIVVERAQVLGRLAYELFEFTDTTYYSKGPRSWPLEVYRVLQT